MRFSNALFKCAFQLRFSNAHSSEDFDPDMVEQFYIKLVQLTIYFCFYEIHKYFILYIYSILVFKHIRYVVENL